MSYEAENLRQRFDARNEIVGWTQGPHGSSRPVNGIVIGREMRGIVSDDENNIRLRIQTYIKPSGNEYPLSLVKNSSKQMGLSGHEFVITDDVSPEYAFGLDYSQMEPVTLSEKKMQEASLLLVPLIAELPYLFHLSPVGQEDTIRDSAEPVNFL